ncbi:MAG: DPP IV N-terminal domain-containing protein [Pseudomonadota bacterium]
MKRIIGALGALVLAGCAGSAASQTEATLAETSPELTIERLYASPSLSGPSPRSVKYSPDGKRVTFLKAREADAARFDLWQFDVSTGEPSMLVDSTLLEPEEVELSEEEKALRERKRIAGSRGIVSYDWGTADTILVPIGGDLWLVTLNEEDWEGESVSLPDAIASMSQGGLSMEEAAAGLSSGVVVGVRQLTETEAFEYDARVSPDGGMVSFVRDGAVYAIDLETGEEQRLTPLAEPDKAISYGVAEFVAQEEMSRYTGYWWSPDARYLAYTRVDESTVDIIPRFDIAAEEVTVINQRYPRAGRPNAVVDLFVRDMETGEVVEIDWRRDDWGPATDQYLARVDWISGIHISIQSVGRDQEQLQTSYADVSSRPFSSLPGSFQTTTVPQRIESQRNWINLNNDLRTIDGWQILSSEEPTQAHSGFRHLYASRGDQDTNLLRAITSGSWSVDAVAGTDNQVVYFTGYRDSPLERHFYAVNFEFALGESYSFDDLAEPTRITPLGSSWSITMAPDGQSFVGTSSSPNQPPQTGLYRLLNLEEKMARHQAAGGGAQSSDVHDCEDLVPGAAALQVYCGPQYELIAWTEENALDETHPYFPYLGGHTVPDYGTLTAEDGQTLYYSIQTPPDFDPAKQYPVLVNVYGGPGVQTVDRDWERWDDQFYTRQGYIVFRLDNRGSANRGKAFEDVIYRQTGGPEVRDQLLGVEWLKSQDFVDPDRIAIQGWSYGGYMTLMTMLQAEPGTFAAAVSGAPVTDWTLYDTFYTERYMDNPQDNPEGYEKSSVFYHLDRFEGEMPELLLIHGMADDNVTFDNTTRLMAALQERGQTFDLMTYPGQRHGIRGEALRTHLMRTRMAFLDRHLKGE